MVARGCGPWRSRFLRFLLGPHDPHRSALLHARRLPSWFSINVAARARPGRGLTCAPPPKPSTSAARRLEATSPSVRGPRNQRGLRREAGGRPQRRRGGTTKTKTPSDSPEAWPLPSSPLGPPAHGAESLFFPDSPRYFATGKRACRLSTPCRRAAETPQSPRTAPLVTAPPCHTFAARVLLTLTTSCGSTAGLCRTALSAPLTEPSYVGTACHCRGAEWLCIAVRQEAPATTTMRTRLGTRTQRNQSHDSLTTLRACCPNSVIAPRRCLHRHVGRSP